MGKSKRKTKFIPLVFAPEEEAAAPPPWAELPLDLTANILRRLGDVDILHSAQLVCSAWWKVCRDPYMWRTINVANKEPMYLDRCTAMYRCAVDRSQGQLIDLSIGFHIYDELLYGAERSRHLRRLTIAFCSLLSRTTLMEAVKLLPELEELHLFISHLDILSEDIESIGFSCPRLKSFTLIALPKLSYDIDDDAGGGGGDLEGEGEEEEVDDDDEDDDGGDLEGEEADDDGDGDGDDEGEEEVDDANNGVAAAIARSMPNLQHLVLITNALNNRGLEAILERCRHLESLDLRRCFGVDLDGELRERCFEQIKNVRLPFDSFDDDYAWALSSHLSASVDKAKGGRMPSHSFSYWFDVASRGGGGEYDSEFDDYDYGYFDLPRGTADQIVFVSKKLGF